MPGNDFVTADFANLERFEHFFFLLLDVISLFLRFVQLKLKRVGWLFRFFFLCNFFFQLSDFRLQIIDLTFHNDINNLPKSNQYRLAALTLELYQEISNLVTLRSRR